MKRSDTDFTGMLTSSGFVLTVSPDRAGRLTVLLTAFLEDTLQYKLTVSKEADGIDFHVWYWII